MAVLSQCTVVELWRLRGVSRSFRRWCIETLDNLPRLLAIGGACKQENAGWQCLVRPRPSRPHSLTRAAGAPQPAQLPRGWSTRVATSTGRSVWEQAFHRVRLEHEPDASRGG